MKRSQDVSGTFRKKKKKDSQEGIPGLWFGGTNAVIHSLVLPSVWGNVCPNM